MQEALGYFQESDNASGYARALGMAAIVLLADGDAELGARIAGATYRLVREKGVMLAPVKVLHLPDPAETATERFGADRAAELLAEGEAIPIDEVVAHGPGEAVTGTRSGFDLMAERGEPPGPNG